MTDDSIRASVHHVRHLSDHAGGTASVQRTVGLVRHVTDHAGATDSIGASAAFLLAQVSLTGDGEVTRHSSSAVDQVVAFVHSLTLLEQLALLEWVRERIVAALQDPRTESYGAILALPLLVIILRALRRSR